MDIASINANLHQWDKNHGPICPSCSNEAETCEHILLCPEEGRVAKPKVTISNMDHWLDSVGMDPILRDCVVEFANGRGGIEMWQVCTIRHG